MKTVMLVVTTIFALAGLALILPDAAQWDALQIQAGLGNSAPLMNAYIHMAGGMICLGLAWIGYKKTG